MRSCWAGALDAAESSPSEATVSGRRRDRILIQSSVSRVDRGSVTVATTIVVSGDEPSAIVVPGARSVGDPWLERGRAAGNEVARPSESPPTGPPKVVVRPEL